MIDLAKIRLALTEPFAESFNAYEYPTGQPETPGVVLPEVDRITFHVGYCEEAAKIDWRMQLFAADAETMNALEQLEQALAVVPSVLESIDAGGLWQTLTVSEASNTRVHEQTGALSVDLVFTMEL